jgi:multicomponent Na+:H+ antiporter subunit D
MVSQAAIDGHLQTVWLLLAAASAGVFLHAGIKFPWFVFFQKDSGLRPPDPPASLRWAMGLFAFLCIALGVWPEPLYALLPYPVDYAPYTAAHVITQLQLLLFAGLAFFVMLGHLKRTPTITLDVDWLWRVAGPAIARSAHRIWQAARARLADATAAGAAIIDEFITRHRQPGGLLLRSWPSGGMALWVMVMLLANLLFYYLG